MNTLVMLTGLAAEKTPPEAEDVVAGWTGLVVILVLILATVLLCWSFVRQIRKAKRAKDDGVYGDTPVNGEPVDDQDRP